MHRVVLEAVVRGQIEAAAEPPADLPIAAIGDEEPQVAVGRGGVWVARVDDQRQRNSLKPLSCELRAPSRRGGRQSNPDRVRKVDGGSLEHRSIAEHPRTGETAALPVEGQRLKLRRLVFLLESSAYLVLEVEKVFAYCIRVHIRLHWSKDTGRAATRQP